jgi:hypothetical protein
MRAFAVARLMVVGKLIDFHYLVELDLNVFCVGLLPILAIVSFITGLVLLISPSVNISMTIHFLPNTDITEQGGGVAAVSSVGSTLNVAVSALTFFIAIPGCVDFACLVCALIHSQPAWVFV